MRLTRLQSADLAAVEASALTGRYGDVARGVDNASYRYRLGVVAAITPFNFPCMVPLWTLPVAIAAGNAYVIKPSERTPLSVQKLGELLSEAGLPDGVFSIVNGAREAVDAILEQTSPGIG